MPRKQEVWYYAVVDSEKHGPLLHAFDSAARRDAFVRKNRAAGAAVEAVGVRRAYRMKRHAGAGVEIRHRSLGGGAAARGAVDADAREADQPPAPDARRSDGGGQAPAGKR